MLTSVKSGTRANSSLLHRAAFEQLAGIRLHRKHPALLLDVIQSCQYTEGGTSCMPQLLTWRSQCFRSMPNLAVSFSVLRPLTSPFCDSTRLHERKAYQSAPGRQACCSKQAPTVPSAGTDVSCRQGRSSFTADLARAAAAACCRNAILMGNTGRQHGIRRQTALSCRTLRPQGCIANKCVFDGITDSRQHCPVEQPGPKAAWLPEGPKHGKSTWPSAGQGIL